MQENPTHIIRSRSMVEWRPRPLELPRSSWLISAALQQLNYALAYDSENKEMFIQHPGTAEQFDRQKFVEKVPGNDRVRYVKRRMFDQGEMELFGLRNVQMIRLGRPDGSAYPIPVKMTHENGEERYVLVGPLHSTTLKEDKPVVIGSLPGAGISDFFPDFYDPEYIERLIVPNASVDQNHAVVCLKTYEIRNKNNKVVKKRYLLVEDLTGHQGVTVEYATNETRRINASDIGYVSDTQETEFNHDGGLGSDPDAIMALARAQNNSDASLETTNTVLESSVAFVKKVIHTWKQPLHKLTDASITELFTQALEESRNTLEPKLREIEETRRKAHLPLDSREAGSSFTLTNVDGSRLYYTHIGYGTRLYVFDRVGGLRQISHDQTQYAQDLNANFANLNPEMGYMLTDLVTYYLNTCTTQQEFIKTVTGLFAAYNADPTPEQVVAYWGDAGSPIHNFTDAFNRHDNTVEAGIYPVDPGNLVILATQGLWLNLTHGEIESILHSAQDLSPDEIGELLRYHTRLRAGQYVLQNPFARWKNKVSNLIHKNERSFPDSTTVFLMKLPEGESIDGQEIDVTAEQVTPMRRGGMLQAIGRLLKRPEKLKKQRGMYYY